MIEELIRDLTGLGAFGSIVGLAYLDAQIISQVYDGTLKSYADGVKYYWHLASKVEIKDLGLEPKELGEKYPLIKRCLWRYPTEIEFAVETEEPLKDFIARKINSN